MTKEQIEKAYGQYQPLLHKLSQQCSNRCGRPEEDCYGQACYLFMRAITTHDPNKGKLTTYLYAYVRNGLVDWGRKMDLPPNPEYLPEQETTLTPDKQLMFKEWLGNLSEECREVAAIILNGPAEILEFGNGNLRKITSSSIMKYLLSRGWSWPKARRTLRDLKTAVASL
jgi:DNA-directed RNA polymerase specialized sigma subunit